MTTVSRAHASRSRRKSRDEDNEGSSLPAVGIHETQSPVFSREGHEGDRAAQPEDVVAAESHSNPQWPTPLDTGFDKGAPPLGCSRSEELRSPPMASGSFHGSGTGGDGGCLLSLEAHAVSKDSERQVNSGLPGGGDEISGRLSPSCASLPLVAAALSPVEDTRLERDSSIPVLKPSLSIPNLLVTSPSLTSVSYVCEADRSAEGKAPSMDALPPSHSAAPESGLWRECDERGKNSFFSSGLPAHPEGNGERAGEGQDPRSGDFETPEEAAFSVQRILQESEELFLLSGCAREDRGGESDAAFKTMTRSEGAFSREPAHRHAFAKPGNGGDSEPFMSIDEERAASPSASGPSSYAFLSFEETSAGSRRSPDAQSPPLSGHLSDGDRTQRKAGERFLEDPSGNLKRSRSPLIARDCNRSLGTCDSSLTTRGPLASDTSPRRGYTDQWHSHRKAQSPGRFRRTNTEGNATPVDSQSSPPSKKRCCLAERFAFERRRQPPVPLPSVASAVAAALAQFPPGVCTAAVERADDVPPEGSGNGVLPGGEVSDLSLSDRKSGASPRQTLDTFLPAKGASAALKQEGSSSEIGEGCPASDDAAVAAALSGWKRGRGPRSVCVSGSSRASSLEHAGARRRSGVERKRREKRKAALATAAVVSASVRRLALVAAPCLVENTLRQWWRLQEQVGDELDNGGVSEEQTTGRSGRRTGKNPIVGGRVKEGEQSVRLEIERSGDSPRNTAKTEPGDQGAAQGQGRPEQIAENESGTEQMETSQTKQEAQDLPLHREAASASATPFIPEGRTQERDSYLRVTLFAASQVLNSGQFRQAIRMFPGADSPRGDQRSRCVVRVYKQSLRKRRLSGDRNRRVGEDGNLVSVSLRDLLANGGEDWEPSSPSAATRPLPLAPSALSAHQARSSFGSFSRRSAEGVPGPSPWGGDCSPTAARSPLPLSTSHDLRRRRVCPPRRRYSPSESVHSSDGRGGACAIAAKKPKGRRSRGREEQTREEVSESRCSTPRSCSSVRYAVSDGSPASSRAHLGRPDDEGDERMTGGQRTPRGTPQEGEDSDFLPAGMSGLRGGTLPLDQLGERSRSAERWMPAPSVAVVPFAPNILAKKHAEDVENQLDGGKMSLDGVGQKECGLVETGDTGEQEAAVAASEKRRPLEAQTPGRHGTTVLMKGEGLLAGGTSEVDGDRTGEKTTEISPFSEATGICILRRSPRRVQSNSSETSRTAVRSTESLETSDKLGVDVGATNKEADSFSASCDSPRDSLERNVGEIVAIWARARDAKQGGRIRRRVWLPPGMATHGGYEGNEQNNGAICGGGATPMMKTERAMEEGRGDAKTHPVGGTYAETEKKVVDEMKAWWSKLTCASVEAVPVQTLTLDDFARAFSTVANRAVDLLCLAFRARGAGPVFRPVLSSSPKQQGNSPQPESEDVETRIETYRQQVRRLYRRRQQLHEATGNSPFSSSRVGGALQRRIGELQRLREAHGRVDIPNEGPRREEDSEKCPASLWDVPLRQRKQGRKRVSPWYSVGVRWLADFSAFEYFVVKNYRKEDLGATVSLSNRGEASDTTWSVDGTGSQRAPVPCLSRAGTPRTVSPSPPSADAMNLWAQAYAPSLNQPRGMSPATTPPLSESATPRGNVSPPFSEASSSGQRGKKVAPGPSADEKKDEDYQSAGSLRWEVDGGQRRQVQVRSRLLLHELLQPPSLDATGLRTALVLIVLRLQRFLRLKEGGVNNRGRGQRSERKRRCRAMRPIFIFRDDSNAFQEALLAKKLDIRLDSDSPHTDVPSRRSLEGEVGDERRRLRSVKPTNSNDLSDERGPPPPSTMSPHSLGSGPCDTQEGVQNLQQDASLFSPALAQGQAHAHTDAVPGARHDDVLPRSPRFPVVDAGPEETPRPEVESMLDSESGDPTGLGQASRRRWRGRGSRTSVQRTVSTCLHEDHSGDKTPREEAFGGDAASLLRVASSVPPSTCSSPQPSSGGRRERGRRGVRGRRGRGRLISQQGSSLLGQTVSAGALSSGDTAGAISTEGENRRNAVRPGALEHSDEDKEDLSASSPPSDDGISQRSSGSQGDSSSSGGPSSEACRKTTSHVAAKADSASPRALHPSARPQPRGTASWTPGGEPAVSGVQHPSALTPSPSRGRFSEDNVASRVSRVSSVGALLRSRCVVGEEQKETQNSCSLWVVEKGALEPFWWRTASAVGCVSAGRRDHSDKDANRLFLADKEAGTGPLQDFVLPDFSGSAKEIHGDERGSDSDASCKSAALSTTSDSSGISEVSLDLESTVQEVALGTILSSALSALHGKTGDGDTQESDAEREANADDGSATGVNEKDLRGESRPELPSPIPGKDELGSQEEGKTASSLPSVKAEQGGSERGGADEIVKKATSVLRACKDTDEATSTSLVPEGEDENDACGAFEPDSLVSVSALGESSEELFTEVPQNEKELKKTLQHVDPRLCQQMLHGGLCFIRTYVDLETKKESLQAGPFAAKRRRVAQLLRGLQGLFDALESVREREGDDLSGEHEGDSASGGLFTAEQEKEGADKVSGDRENAGERGQKTAAETGDQKASIEDAVAAAFCRRVGAAIATETCASIQTVFPEIGEAYDVEDSVARLGAPPRAPVRTRRECTGTGFPSTAALPEPRGEDGRKQETSEPLGVEAADKTDIQGEYAQESEHTWTQEMGRKASLFLSGTLELAQLKEEQQVEELQGEGDPLTSFLLPSDQSDSTKKANEECMGGRTARELYAEREEDVKTLVRRREAQTESRARGPYVDSSAEAASVAQGDEGGEEARKRKKDEKREKRSGNAFLDALLEPALREDVGRAFLTDFGSQAPQNSTDAGKPIFLSPCVFGVRGGARWKKLGLFNDEAQREGTESSPWRNDSSDPMSYRADAPHTWRRHEGLLWGGSRHAASALRHHGRKSPAFLSPQWEDDERLSLSSSADERGYTSSGSERFLSIPTRRKYGLRFQRRSTKTGRAPSPTAGRSSVNRSGWRETLRPSSGFSGEETPRSLSSRRRRGGLGGSSPTAFRPPMTRAATGKAAACVRHGDGDECAEPDSQFGAFGSADLGLSDRRGEAGEADTREEKAGGSARHGKRGSGVRSGGAREAGSDAGTDTLWVAPGSGPNTCRSGRKSPAAAALSSLPTGVYFDASRKLWRCQWRENGRFKTKGFSLNVYKTLKEARRACVVYRCLMGGWEVDPRWLGPDDDEQDNSGGADEVGRPVPSDGISDVVGEARRKGEY
ncbi:AP2 domain transcription factor AP2XI-4 [Toxoplasma gondii RUB]|uniref:AP2 domain transcription factor AP2XI-4 n=1 Tax=Toxoplasma gondii RUB TaxID=935652 RepID=A0A086MBW6_TOXGO|nr:AP2 domain transcription factor AP2XI-4 [Toxoplasma gondii RUB]